MRRKLYKTNKSLLVMYSTAQINLPTNTEVYKFSRLHRSKPDEDNLITNKSNERENPPILNEYNVIPSYQFVFKYIYVFLFYLKILQFVIKCI